MDYLERLGGMIGLRKGNKESAKAYQRRILLSVVSDWMQTAVHTGEEMTSVVHVKQVGMEKLHAFQELGCLDSTFDIQALVAYVYDTLLENGAFLHRSHNVRPAPHRLIGDDAIAIVRGMCPEELVRFSGLAPYVKQRVAPCAVEGAFDLPMTSPEQITTMLWKHGIPVSRDIRVDEYLNTERSSRGQYYIPRPPKAKGLLYGYAYNPDGQHDFYLISETEAKRISPDYILLHYHEYARLFLMTQNQSQNVYARFDGNSLVYLEFNFHLPDPDLRFLRYIAWPNKGDVLDDAWNFSISCDLWPLLKTRLEFLDYKVVEIHA